MALEADEGAVSATGRRLVAILPVRSGLRHQAGNDFTWSANSVKLGGLGATAKEQNR